MPQKKNKKIFIYFFLFLILSSANNQILKKIEYPKLKNIQVIGLDKIENLEIENKLTHLKLQNLYFLNPFQIKEILDENSLIETYSVFKKFPSTIIIEIKKTRILASTYKNDFKYYIGSNGKLIKAKNNKIDKPLVFGNFNNTEFLKLKEIIDKSKLDYRNIKKIYFFNSGRWDIELLDGLLIKLPEKKFLQSINISMDLISKNKIENIKIIDNRIEGQVILNE
tara:strand:+ start:110 stop:781 length:672 start_codon:yes stop_codon:yes gene_type:complete